MTWGPHDLRLAEALAEQRLEAARRARVTIKKRPSARGAPSEKIGGRGRVAVRRPAHSGAAGNN